MKTLEPVRIVFLLEDLCYGGTQMQNIELASRLDRKLFSPVILTLTGPTDLDSKVGQAGIPLVNMGSSRTVAPFFFFRLGRQIAKLKPDILVPCTALPNIWGRIWGRLMKVPVIIGTCRGGGAPQRQHERLLWRLCDGMICNSRALVADLAYLGVPREKLTYIANGVDTERFKPVLKKFSAEDALIVCVARLAQDKDHKTLLKAFSRVNEHFPEARLRIVGEGPEEKALRKFVAQELSEQAANQVEFAGPSADPARHYAEADIFALASIREGQPNAILEAMSCGLPICATDVGAVPSLLDGNGLISQPRDAEGLANNLLTFMRAPGMAQYFGKMSRAKAELEHSYSSMVQAHQDLFLKLYQKGA